MRQAVIGFDISEVGQVAGIGEFIEVDHRPVGVFAQYVADEVAANEATTSCDEQSPPTMWHDYRAAS